MSVLPVLAQASDVTAGAVLTLAVPLATLVLVIVWWWVWLRRRRAMPPAERG